MSALRQRLDAFVQSASHRPDIIVAAFMLLAIMMMLIPLPTALVDGLIALNISISLLVLIVAICMGRPASFSSLPPIILLATLFRLSLSISTTRLILLHADAGQIVETFGRFVIGGQVLIGLVIFLIITVAQFLVITKGAERVAEVAARFTLDAMPGKQMSIDTDLRNGDIDQAQARERRGRLERESQLYGAMDGAMKFVKGDAITSLIIVCINLVGGLLTGMVQKGMDFAQAGTTYSLLTVGDGLIAQIPALLISVAAGTVVTRVANGNDEGLGSEIFRQLGASERPLAIAAAATGASALIPGFPTFIFLFLGLCFGGAAWMVRRRRLAASPARVQAAPDAGAATDLMVEDEQDVSALPAALVSDGPARVSLVVHVGAHLARQAAGRDFVVEVDRRRLLLHAELGLEMPSVKWLPDPSLAPDAMRIDLEAVPVAHARMPQGFLLAEADRATLALLDVDVDVDVDVDAASQDWPVDALWIRAQDAAPLRDAGISLLDVVAVMARCVERTLRQYAAHFIGVQEARDLLSAMETDNGELVREAVRLVSVKKLSDILRALLEEKVPVGNLRLILEALVEWAPSETDTGQLAERVRAALSRQICHRHAQLDRILSACVLTRGLEQALRDGSRQGGITLSRDNAEHMLGQIREILSVQPDTGMVVLTPADLRRGVRQYLVHAGIDLPVLSYTEIAADYSVQSVASLDLPTPQLEATGDAAPKPAMA
ncbi:MULTISPECIES: type III secretion system export apparatus subunit SctV [unclassified Sphingobium]|uniref:type III secretion system export apparatus subunit SctV n=1 Tax=unclassified Sphingobium TaxID=2611147 RepID=UPI0035A57F06